MESKWFCKYKSTKKFIPSTYVFTHTFNGDFIFFIQRITSSNLVCISNVSYLQLTFNLQLKNEHVCGLGLARWSLSMFFMVFLGGFFHLFCILSTCVWKISFSKSKVLLYSLSVKKASGRLILNKQSLKWVFVKENLFSNNLCFLLLFDCLYRKCKKH